MSSGACTSPIFIVGVPRSGTTLLAAFLGSHSHLSCGTETDFFHFLSQVNEASLLAVDNWPNAATNFLFRQIPGKGRKAVPEEYGLTRADVLAYLQHQPPSVSAILAAVTEQFMQRAGKHRWVEKTPNHLLHLDRIRCVYPDAKIIRIVRDPRDTALSILKAPWPWAPRTLVSALSMWRFMDDVSDSFFTNDANAYTIKYEELVADPILTLTRVCDFLGEMFEEPMLAKDGSYKQVNSLNEPWKTKVSERPDSSRIGVWQRELGEEAMALSESLIGDRLIRFDYPRSERPMALATVFPHDAHLRHPEVGDWLSRNNLRTWAMEDHEASVVLLFVGDPEHDNWFGHSRKARTSSFFSLCRRLLSTTRKGTHALWLKPRRTVSAGLLAQAFGGLIGMLGHTDVLEADVQNDINWRFNLLHNPRLAAEIEADARASHLSHTP
jgi:hypothetical protein